MKNQPERIREALELERLSGEPITDAAPSLISNCLLLLKWGNLQLEDWALLPDPIIGILLVRHSQFIPLMPEPKQIRAMRKQMAKPEHPDHDTYRKNGIAHMPRRGRPTTSKAAKPQEHGSRKAPGTQQTTQSLQSTGGPLDWG
jgi:hypothetical protein